MKDKIRSAQIVLPCADLSAALEFFSARLGFRLEMIAPADAPAVAVISGYGVTLRLESASETPPSSPPTLRLTGDFSAAAVREIFSPDGVRVILADAPPAEPEIPEGAQEFIVSTLAGANSWSEGRARMQYRDLIPGRAGGRFVASHIRIRSGGEVPDYVHFHRIRFQMIYCLSGWARLVYEDQGAPFLMRAGDCVLQPPAIRHRVLECSAGFEVLEIGSPAVHETFADHRLNLPNEIRAPEKIFGGQRFLHHIAENAVWSATRIEGIESREIGIAEAANGLAAVRVLRATASASFSVRHAGEFFFVFILGGKLRLSGEDGIYDLAAHDSFVLPAGAEYRIEAEKGLEMIEVSLPANVETRKKTPA